MPEIKLFFEDMTEGEPPFPLTEDEMIKTSEAVINKALELHDCDMSCQVDLYLTDNETIREMNRENRDIDKVTDVLSFPNLPFDPSDIADFGLLKSMPAVEYTDPESGRTQLGEIVICKSKVIEQASEYGHSIKREFAFLTAHSILHLLGYDHMEDGDRTLMEGKQREILDSLGITRTD